VSEVRIVAEPRTEFGKGAARRTRRAGRVPAVLYGHGTEPRHVSLPGHDLMLALKGGRNTLLELEMEGSTELALPRAVVRDPIKGDFEHLDLLLVSRGEKVTVNISINVIGDAAPDSIVDLQVTAIPVTAEATHIPGHLEVDVTGLTPGQSITAADVPLPSGVTLDIAPETVVVQVLGLSVALVEDVPAVTDSAALGAPVDGGDDA
jgi:large subunit ribosomal protein L25